MLHKIITEDGSPTFLNDKLGEHYHSTGGAIAEARQKHVLPANISERYKNNGGQIRILDFAFGLGYNSATALDHLLNDGVKNPNIEITALENDREIISKISSLQPDLKGYDVFQEFAGKVDNFSGFIRPFVFDKEKISFILFLEDALTRISFLKNNYYDVIFFDPFSSGRAPSLWSENVFKILFQKIKKGGCLSTYSCARHFRNKLQRTGFTWQDVPPGFERRGPSTIAFKP